MFIHNKLQQRENKTKKQNKVGLKLCCTCLKIHNCSKYQLKPDVKT